MLNLAFIGSEADAQRYGSIANRIDGARWSAFAPLDPAHSAKGKALLGATIESESMAGLLANNPNDVDALVIHAPPEMLPDLVKTAAPSGKQMLVGPLWAKNTTDFATLMKSMPKQGTLVPACPWRFIPAIQSVKNSINSGNLGEIGLIRIHRWNAQITTENYDIPSRIIPEIDIATWFFGAQPQKVFALKSSAVEQYIQIHLHFENGGMVVIDEAGALPNGGDYFSLTVIGGTGAAYADDHRNMNLIVDGVYPHAIRTEPAAVHIAHQLQAFVDTVRGESQSPFTQQDIANVLQISDAVIEAATTNQVSVWEDGKYVCG